MPKINPIFTLSKINLKLTKKSSCFIFSNYFIKKLLEFYIVSSSVFNMFPFKKRNCVSVLRSMYFHTLHHYYDLIGLLAVLPVVLVVLALVTTVPCLSETTRPPRYAVDTLTSRPALKRRWCPIESGITIQPMLVSAKMRASPTTLSRLTTLDCFRLSL